MRQSAESFQDVPPGSGAVFPLLWLKFDNLEDRILEKIIAIKRRMRLESATDALGTENLH